MTVLPLYHHVPSTTRTMGNARKSKHFWLRLRRIRLLQIIVSILVYDPALVSARCLHASPRVPLSMICPIFNVIFHLSQTAKRTDLESTYGITHLPSLSKHSLQQIWPKELFSRTAHNSVYSVPLLRRKPAAIIAWGITTLSIGISDDKLLHMVYDVDSSRTLDLF